MPWSTYTSALSSSLWTKLYYITEKYIVILTNISHLKILQKKKKKKLLKSLPLKPLFSSIPDSFLHIKYMVSLLFLM